MSYGQFTVDPGKQFQTTLTYPLSYQFNRTTVSRASVTCNNTSDPGQQETVQAGFQGS